MPQAGIHGMVGTTVRKWTGGRQWLLLGIVLGNFVPDMDNVVVAIATVLKLPSDHIHRTFTHSIFFVIVLTLVFYVFGTATKKAEWSTLGIGLGVGVLMHILLDLVIWFNGVEILWPIPSWVNLWANIQPPDWFMTFMNPAEFLCFGLFLMYLGSWARKFNTDGEFLKTLRNWIILEFGLFIIFTPLAYIMTKGYLTVFGIFYLFSLFMTFFVAIRMRKTIEAAG